MSDLAPPPEPGAILARLTALLAEVLHDSPVAAGPATRREDVPGWDSFAQINLTIAAEAAFGIRYRLSDLERFDTLADIAAATAERLAARR
ncbi:MAG: acyl carrier protein [Rhodospirillales bacterium]|nr:acyl carrier protein [Rhodospirillales bacterium]